MKNIKIKIGLLLLVLTLGCKKLDEVPFSVFSVENLYQNEADVDKAIIGTYAVLNMDLNDLWYFLMTSGPSEHVVARLKTAAQGRMTSLGFLATDGPINAMWNSLYTGINRANAVIDNTSKAGLSPELENQKIAEARFLRAFYYFHLVKFFGGVPLQLTETTDFSEEAIKKSRSSVEEVYLAIEQDLLFAETHLLPTVPAAQNGRATSYAAKALLGKVYLNMAGKPLEKTEMYAKAITKLTEVLGKYSLVNNYASIFATNSEFGPEIIFARPNVTGTNGIGTPLTFFAGAPNTPFAFNGGQYQFGMSEALYNSYALTDKRRDVTFLYTYTDRGGRSVTYGSPTNPTGLPFGGPRSPNGIPLGKYKDATNSLSAVAHGNDFIYLRYADVLLMLAEAYNEDNKAPQALPHLNEVRLRAGLTIPITETDKTLLRAIIKRERKWELAGEFTEYFDLQRWGDIEASMALNPDSRQQNVTYEPKLELFPIPDAQLRLNENLTPNPGY